MCSNCDYEWQGEGEELPAIEDQREEAELEALVDLLIFPASPLFGYRP
jgi:hypothetical protein